jgi:hypothetical protein
MVFTNPNKLHLEQIQRIITAVKRKDQTTTKIFSKESVFAVSYGLVFKG